MTGSKNIMSDLMVKLTEYKKTFTDIGKYGLINTTAAMIKIKNMGILRSIFCESLELKILRDKFNVLDIEDRTSRW